MGGAARTLKTARSEPLICEPGENRRQPHREVVRQAQSGQGGGSLQVRDKCLSHGISIGHGESKVKQNKKKKSVD
jgi:hypothetical protein